MWVRTSKETLTYRFHLAGSLVTSVRSRKPENGQNVFMFFDVLYIFMLSNETYIFMQTLEQHNLGELPQWIDELDPNLYRRAMILPGS